MGFSVDVTHKKVDTGLRVYLLSLLFEKPVYGMPLSIVVSQLAGWFGTKHIATSVFTLKKTKRGKPKGQSN